ncbi:prephenate dehydratase [Candidatus Woesearchaeota archaeon]|nr:prephenate dehydratase [Candidatus Woesearchaeota archaeon]
MKVAYQGRKGAYSEAAVQKYFGDVESTGFDTFEDVFEAMKEYDYALLPFENTIAGSVIANYDLLLRSDLYIVGEVYLDIHHCLLSIGSDISLVKRVYSHPHALNQSREFLRSHGMEPIPDSDTAESARKVAKRKDIGEGAIASKFCAKIYSLNVLAENIESNKGNSTRFFVLSSVQGPFKDKTTIAFKAKHRPGSLVMCLTGLAANGINLTKLESRNIPDNPWEYVFYVDVEHGPGFDNAIEQMKENSIFVKVLGSYGKG